MSAGYIVNVVEIVTGSSVCRLPSSVTKEPGRDDDQGTVENYEREKVRQQHEHTEREGRGRHTEEGENQPNVSPPVPIVHVQRGIVLIPDRDGTVPTEPGFGRVIQVPAKVSNELVRPGRARLVQGWVEDREFLRIACDLEPADKRNSVG
jgi:hypothetical protein